MIISEGGIQKAKYYYDGLNQVVRKDNACLNKTIMYTHDTGSNIMAKTEYAYTTGTLGTPTATYSYSNADANWKDKLAAYGGTTITYDQIGNPLNYYNGYAFTWQNGWQFATANNGTNS